ncbi:YlbE-like family protein [Fredinandcohnia sp. 179-A 10B2 NHS]|uniref:YlbE-like family protein n=1 Tax=Fredinandcohnia sp. 179-A 10B2 NHS TaxID=3235176 RepID=UPI0039A22B41
MRKETLDYIQSNKQLQSFIRENPIWYRRLTRNPNDLQRMQIEAREYYKQTFPHKIKKFNNSLEMASFMLQMYQGMRQSD